MNKSYLSSIKNTLLSSKPSTTIRLLLMVLFVASKKINPSNLYFKFLITLFFLIGFVFNGLNAQCARPETPSPSSPLGSATPCEGSTVTYSITSSKNATSYSWFYPSDWVVLSGATTNEITFKIGQTSGNIGVFGVNCGNKSYDSSQRNIQIIRKPTTPSQPTSYNASCNGFTAQWGTDGTQVNYLVDVSTDPNFSSFVAPYQGYNAGNVQNIVLTGLVSSTTYYYRIRRSSSCGISDDYSPSNSVTTSPGGGAGGTVTGGGTVCSGNNSGLLTLSGHNGTVQKWQSAVSPFIIWSDISNTGKTYTSGALYSTTQFRAVVLSGTCATVSGAVVVTVNATSTITGIVTPATCSNGSDGAVTITGLNVPIEFKKSDNDYIDLGSSFLSNRNAFTVEGWVKFDINNVGARMSLFGQNDVVEFYLHNTNTIELWTPNTGAITTPLTAAIGNNAWHHIAATGNGTSTRIYIDGVLAVTGSGTANYGTSAYNAQIGSGVVDPLSPTGGGFTGQIGKVGFYSTALSAGTIASLASSPTTYSGTETGIIAGYNFSEGSGTTLTSLPAGKNGTFENSPQWTYTYAWT